MNMWNTVLSPIMLTLLCAAPVLAGEKAYVYHWTEYIPDSVQEQFSLLFNSDVQE